MKLNPKHIMLCGALMCAAAPLAAQDNFSGYFLENYIYRYEMNPALSGCEKGFVAFPALGNVNYGMHGDIGIKNLFYNRGGRTVLFSNPLVSTEDALSGLKSLNKNELDMRLHLINFGFSGLGGFNTVGINAVVSANSAVPYSMFELIKEGVGNKTYDLSGFQSNAMAYAEIALNHSHNIVALPGLRVGGTVKVLLGAGHMDAKFNQLQLQLDRNEWIVNSDVYTEASVKGLRYTTEYDDLTHQNYVDDISVDHGGINGWGLGFDLGAQYRWDDFNFSAAITDLGFIKFDETYRTSNTLQEFRSNAYTLEVGDNDATWDTMRGDLTRLMQQVPENDGENTGGSTKSLCSTLTLGVGYEFPYYRKLTFGLLNSTRFCGDFTRNQLRLSANVAPAKAFSASVNGVWDTFGVGWGWMMNVSCTGFNLFLGMDQTFVHVSKEGIPLASNLQMNFGLNFPF